MNHKNFVPAKFVNLTGLDLTIIDKTGRIVDKILASGQVARVDYIVAKTGEINGIPTFSKHVRGIAGMPEEKENEVYIVTEEVRAAIWGNPYVVAPFGLNKDRDGISGVCEGLQE